MSESSVRRPTATIPSPASLNGAPTPTGRAMPTFDRFDVVSVPFRYTDRPVRLGRVRAGVRASDRPRLGGHDYGGGEPIMAWGCASRRSAARRFVDPVSRPADQDRNDRGGAGISHRQ